MTAQDAVTRVRTWLNGPGKNKVVILWQCVVAAYLLWLIATQSLSKGAFPTKKVDDPLMLLVLYGIIIWCLFALIAAIAIFLKKAWGWWLEFVILTWMAVVALAYVWFGNDVGVSSFIDWVQLLAAVMMTLAAVSGLREFYKMVKRETSGTTAKP